MSVEFAMYVWYYKQELNVADLEKTLLYSFRQVIEVFWLKGKSASYFGT